MLGVCALGQTSAPAPAQQQNQEGDEDVIRITSQLIQVDAVVTDKNDQVIPDLKPDEFSLYENGKRQELQFVSYVGADSIPRIEGAAMVAGRAIEPEVARNLSARDLRRVFAFVVDDLTIPANDMTTVRSVLTDFVDKKMAQGDLVAIVRVVGGVGFLQQFTSDKQLLHRAIAELTPRLHPYSVFSNFASAERLDKPPRPTSSGSGEIGSNSQSSNLESVNIPAPGSTMDSDVSLDGYTRGARALSALSVTGVVVDSMRPLPGRKSLVLISGGLPIFESTPTQISINGSPVALQEVRALTTNVTYLINQLSDKASRAGVVINSLDVRGLKASGGVSHFTDQGNEAKSGLVSGIISNGGSEGRTPNMAQFDNKALDALTGHQGLEALAAATGGISVVNTNDFAEGLQRMLSRSSYYLLAYKPAEAFDGKFHKLQIKVNRPGAKVYTRIGYVATPDEASSKTLTKEQAIVRAAMSPLAKNEVDLSGAFQYRFLPGNGASVDMDIRIDAKTLDFNQDSDGKYHTSLDLVGFVFNSVGKVQGGFSQTVNAALSPDDYKRALDIGIGYTGHVDVPTGNYQFRVAVREAKTGKVGSLSKYIEVPDVSKKHLAMSSVFLYAVDPSAGPKAQPVALTALRMVPRKGDLRYSVIVYNAKLEKGSPQLSTQMVINRGDRVIFQGPVSAVDLRGADSSQFVKVGQFGVSKLLPGSYVLTLIIKDDLADKNAPPLLRSIDFNVVE
jgi:VWFA-related protein